MWVVWTRSGGHVRTKAAIAEAPSELIHSVMEERRLDRALLMGAHASAGTRNALAGRRLKHLPLYWAWGLWLVCAWQKAERKWS